MSDTIFITADSEELIEIDDYKNSVDAHFLELSDVAKPLLVYAKENFRKIETMLHSAPAVINAAKAMMPKETYQLLMTDAQKKALSQGVVELLTKKNGALQATLRDPKTKKTVANLDLEKIALSPELSQAITAYAAQMQMAQIAEQIQQVQIAIEEVRRGQEFDRLATAYSCQQKLLQAMTIKNKELRISALLRIAMDAEDSRNLLMQSQKNSIDYVKTLPESFWGKLFSGTDMDKVNTRMNEIRESLNAMNLVSFAEAMAYQEMGESEAAQKSLEYYARYINDTYLSEENLVTRLDLIDPSPQNYWTSLLPEIKKNILAMPCNRITMIEVEKENETTSRNEVQKMSQGLAGGLQI